MKVANAPQLLCLESLFGKILEIVIEYTKVENRPQAASLWPSSWVTAQHVNLNMLVLQCSTCGTFSSISLC